MRGTANELRIYVGVSGSSTCLKNWESEHEPFRLVPNFWEPKLHVPVPILGYMSRLILKF